MTDSNENLSAWTECSPGMLTRLARQSQRNAQHKALGGLAMKSAMSFLILAGTMFGAWWGYVQYNVREYQLDGLTCADVRKLLPELTAGRLNARLEAMLRKHVARCPMCQPLGGELPREVATPVAPLQAADSWTAIAMVPSRCQCCAPSSSALANLGH